MSKSVVETGKGTWLQRLTSRACAGAALDRTAGASAALALAQAAFEGIWASLDQFETSLRSNDTLAIEADIDAARTLTFEQFHALRNRKRNAASGEADAEDESKSSGGKAGGGDKAAAAAALVLVRPQSSRESRESCRAAASLVLEGSCAGEGPAEVDTDGEREGADGE